MNKFKSSWFYAQLGTYDVEKGIFFKKTETHHSERFVDFDDYTQRLQNIYEEFDAEGYDVISVTPINIGQTEQVMSQTKQLIPQKNYIGEVGFSITRGAVIIGKKR